jgi:hypothetical protein
MMRTAGKVLLAVAVEDFHSRFSLFDTLQPNLVCAEDEGQPFEPAASQAVSSCSRGLALLSCDKKAVLLIAAIDLRLRAVLTDRVDAQGQSKQAA